MSGSLVLWLTVAGLGLYHGLNPAMGWPLAVANGLTERRGAAVLRTVLPLGAGHFAAMAVVLRSGAPGSGWRRAPWCWDSDWRDWRGGAIRARSRASRRAGSHGGPSSWPPRTAPG